MTTERARSGPTSGWQRHHFLYAALAVIALALLLIALLPRAAAAGSARSDILTEGRNDYETFCTACHGSEGRGDGRLAEKLIKPPTDLTTIATRNNGAFPFWRVFEIVAGEKPVPGHDTHQMPNFIADLRAQEGKPGFLPARIRVLEITHYLDSMQQ